MTGPAAALLDIDGRIATITLNRPEAYNAIDATLAAALAGIGDELAASDDVRVVILRGAGPTFCAGGDIRTFAANIDALEPMVRDLLGELHRFLVALREGPRLVITSVHGSAAGAGFSLALLGDLCIAAENAKFVPAYAKLGVSPDGGGSIGVVERIGARRALALFLAEDGLTAEEAFQAGLVNKVVPAAELEAATRALAERVSRTAPTAIAATKALIQQSASTPFAAQLDAEMEQMVRCMATPAFRANVEGFLAKSAR
jgi:enoyl-CoA hydratase/carnithine racemase